MRYAGFKLRMKAFLWDYLIILAYIGALVGLSLTITSVQSLFENPVQSDLTAFVLLILPVMAYFAISEGMVGGSWGKRKVKIQVVQTDGKPISIGRAFIRAAVKFLPWQFAHTAIYHSGPNGLLTAAVVTALYILAYGIVALYLITIWRSKTHQAAYDMLVGTAVVTVAE